MRMSPELQQSKSDARLPPRVGSLARAQNLLKGEKFFAAFRTDGQVLFHAGERPLKWKTGDLALGKFTDVALAFGAIEFMLAGLSNHADQAFDLLRSESFHGAKAVRMTSGEIPSATRYSLSAQRAS